MIKKTFFSDASILTPNLNTLLVSVLNITIL